MSRIAFTTLGCKVNQSDTAVIQSSINDCREYTIVPFDDEADIYVVNTCTVTGKGDVESRRLIRKAIRRNSRARIIVTGCYAQTKPGEVAKIKGVSMVLGNEEKYSFMNYLRHHDDGTDNQKIFVGDISDKITMPPPGLNNFSERTRAFLKIQDGCNSKCSYCIVPFARGNSRSLSPDDVVTQIGVLEEAGYKEIVLCGVHLGGYGRDISYSISLSSLIGRILSETDILRIRLSSIEPREITDDLISLMASDERICKHFHIPLQSGDDYILHQMNRNYATEVFENLILKIRGKIEDAGIGCDVMVGYPGEEDQHFNNTCRFIEGLPVTYLHVFTYSPRNGTPAYDIKETVGGDIKRKRSDVIRALGEKKNNKFKDSHIGRVVEVLIEAEEDEATGLSKGYTGNYLKVLIMPPLIRRGERELLAGKGGVVKVKISGIVNDSLSGVLLNVCE